MWRSLPLLLLSSLLCRADVPPFQHDEEYNAGERGRYIQQHFKTSNMVPPLMNYMKPFAVPECDDGSYYFMSPRGNIPNSSFYIMDAEYVYISSYTWVVGIGRLIQYITGAA